MAIQFPTTEIPVEVQGPTPIESNREFVSPLTQTMQFVGSSTQLHEMTFVSKLLDTDQYRVLRTITDKLKLDEIIIPVWERYKQDSEELGRLNFVTNSAEIVTYFGEPIYDTTPWVGNLRVNSASGFVLNVFGAPTDVGFKAGQPISIRTGGRWYLYTLAADSPAGATTKTLTLTSAIRAVHANGDVVAINRAYIQGKGVAAWNPMIGNRYYQLTLTVRELR
jgi:hypothetical protein